MLIGIFDRWISRQKINMLKSQLAHTQDDAKRHILERELNAEQKELEKTLGHKQQETDKH